MLTAEFEFTSGMAETKQKKPKRSIKEAGRTKQQTKTKQQKRGEGVKLRFRGNVCVIQHGMYVCQCQCVCVSVSVCSAVCQCVSVCARALNSLNSVNSLYAQDFALVYF